MGDNQTPYLNLNFGTDAEVNQNWTKLDARLLALARGIFANIPAGGDLQGYYPDPTLAAPIAARLPPAPSMPFDSGKVLAVASDGTLVWVTPSAAGASNWVDKGSWLEPTRGRTFALEFGSSTIHPNPLQASAGLNLHRILVPAAGDLIADLLFSAGEPVQGYAADVAAYASQPWSIGAIQGTALVFRTTRTGAAALSTHTTLQPDGTVRVTTDPVAPLDLATKQYVDAHGAGGAFLPLTGGALSGALDMTSQIINWSTAGLGPPTFGTRSAGTRLVLVPNLGPTALDYAIGVEPPPGPYSMWFSVSNVADAYHWYCGATRVAELSSTGLLLIADPTAPLHAATKQYVDAAAHWTVDPGSLLLTPTNWSSNTGIWFPGPVSTFNMTPSTYFYSTGGANDQNALLQVTSLGTITLAAKWYSQTALQTSLAGSVILPALTGGGVVLDNERLVVNGGIKLVGAALQSADGTIQWTGTHFQGRIGGAWVQLDNAAAVAGLPAGGGTGMVLTKNSPTDYDASWLAPALGGSNGSLGTQSIYTTNTVLSTANHDSLINANAGHVQLTLPAFSTTLSGQLYRITRVDGQPAFQATVMPAGADMIDGVNAFITLAPYESVTLMACGTVANNRQWERVADPTWRTIQTGNVLTPRDGNKILVSQAAGNAFTWGARTVKARLGAGLVADASSSAYLSLNAAAPFTSSPDNTGEPSWLLRLQGTSDNFAVLRAPATSGAPVFASLLTLDNGGGLTLPSGLFYLAFGTRSVGAANLFQLSLNEVGVAGQDTTKPAWRWGVNATADYFFINRAPANTTSYVASMIVDTGANLTIAGAVATKASGTSWANPSDRRLKDDITDYTTGLEAILALRPRTFLYNGKGGSQAGLRGYGYVADEAAVVMPEMLGITKAKLSPEDEAESDIQSLDTSTITLALVNAIKELASRVATLEAR